MTNAGRGIVCRNEKEQESVCYRWSESVHEGVREQWFESKMCECETNVAFERTKVGEM